MFTCSCFRLEEGPPLFLEASAVSAGNESSSRGTMSIKKSNWSDLLSAFAISERERVRRLLESAMIKAREVISEMKTCGMVSATLDLTKDKDNALSHALQKRIGAAVHATKR